MVAVGGGPHLCLPSSEFRGSRGREEELHVSLQLAGAEAAGAVRPAGFVRWLLTFLNPAGRIAKAIRRTVPS